MPKFPGGYTAKTTPVDNDKVLIADSAASDAIKSVTLVNLVKNRIAAILQTVTTWITTSMIGDSQVTYAKLGLSSMPGAIIKTVPGEPGITVGSVKSTTVVLEANVTYLILCSVVWHNAGASTIKNYALRVNGSTIDNHRTETISQMPWSGMGVYRPTSSGTYTIDIYASNVTGSGTGIVTGKQIGRAHV